MTAISGKSPKTLARALHAGLVARARAPIFYARLGVPDSVDGRFDLMALHAWLVLDRLQELGLVAIAQNLTDTLFLGFDEGLRELGSGDMGMGRRLKKLADAFYGRLNAYRMASHATGMADALIRNLYRGDAGAESQAAKVAAYVFSARTYLSRADLENGVAEFGPLPELELQP